MKFGHAEHQCCHMYGIWVCVCVQTYTPTHIPHTEPCIRCYKKQRVKKHGMEEILECNAESVFLYCFYIMIFKILSVLLK